MLEGLVIDFCHAGILDLAMLSTVYWLGTQTLESDCLGLNPAVPFTSHVTLGNLLKPVPRFPYLQNEVKTSATL